MSKITLADLMAAGACGLFVEVSLWNPDTGSRHVAPKRDAKPVKFEATVKSRTGNGDMVAVRDDPNEALQAAKELWMDFARRKEARAAAPAPEVKPKRTRKPKVSDDGLDMV